jgi:hypothetical protein
VPAQKAEVAAEASPNPKPPHDVEDFFKDWVLPKLGAVENTHGGSEPIPFGGFLSVWAPRRYKKHSRKMGKPNLEKLREAMKNMVISYSETRLHLVGEWRAEEGFRITLKASQKVENKTCANNLGSCRFSEELDLRMCKTAWLYIDMMHLIMLFAQHSQADRPTIKKWHMEAKTYLTDMGKKM